MSSVSSVSGSADLYTVLQQINGQSTTSTDNTSATDPTQAAQQTQGSKHAHKHHGGGKGGLSSQVESAVTSALQDAQPGDDPNTLIQNAIAAALKKAQEGGAASVQGDGDADAGATTQGTGPQSGQGGAVSQSDFESLLKSNGVDPKQFQQDFQAAVQSVQQGGSVDFASLFQSFPAGSAVDTVA